MKALMLALILCACSPVIINPQLPAKPVSIMGPCAKAAQLSKGATGRDLLQAHAEDGLTISQCSADQAAESQWIDNLYKAATKP